jgi:hypothetical protein
MEVFIVWISVIGALCIGIMALAIFFTLLSAAKQHFSKTAMIKIKGVFKNSELLNVHLNGSKTLSRVKMTGFTDTDSMKGAPYQLNNMVVFETTEGKRILLRADTIRMIEEISADAPYAAA